MIKHPRAISITLTLVVAHIVAPAVSAHPLGNFTINHYAGLHISTQAIAIDYVLDMAEIPAFQEIAAFDANRNGQPDPEETAPYHPARCEAIRSELDLRLDGRPVALTLNSSAIEFPPGVAGLVTLRLTCAFSAVNVQISGVSSFELSDNSYADRLGWREIVVIPDGVTVEGDFAASSVSNRLTAYPNDLLSSPLNQREVTLTLTPTLPSPETGEGVFSPLPQGEGPGVRSDAFPQLVTLENLGVLALLVALVASLGWAVIHGRAKKERRSSNE